MHLRHGGLAVVLTAGLFGFHPAGAQAPAPSAALSGVGHIVVIFEENRSFDNMFGLFRGANGVSAPGEAAQVDRGGNPYEQLPPIIDSNLNPPAVDPRFPAQLPNAPFQIDRYVPRNVATGDLVHRFYQEQAQIDGGKMDKFAALSDAGGLVMGFYDFSGTAQWRLAKEFTLADNTFHSAFGGSMLNHSFLVCMCAFRWPDAPPKIVASIDGNGAMLK